MNKLMMLIQKEVDDSMNMKLIDSMEYLGTGSIIAFTNVKETKERYDLHGTLAAKLYVLSGCVEAIMKEYNLDEDEILKFVKDTLKRFKQADENRS